MKIIIYPFFIAAAYLAVFTSPIFAEPVVIDEFDPKTIPSEFFGSNLESSRQYLISGDSEKALTSAEAIPEKGAERSSFLQKAIFFRALCAQYLKKDKEAIDGFNKYLSLRPSSPEALYFKSISLARLGNIPAALATIDEALFFDKKSFITVSDLKVHRANLLYAQLLKDKAITELNQAISSNAGNAKAYALLSRIYLENSEKDNAVKNARAALSSSPSNDNWRLLLARSLLLQPDRVNGKKDLEEARALSSAIAIEKDLNPEILDRANQAYIKACMELGQIDAAEKALTAAIKTSSQNPQLISLRDQLKIEKNVVAAVASPASPK